MEIREREISLGHANVAIRVQEAISRNTLLAKDRARLPLLSRADAAADRSPSRAIDRLERLQCSRKGKRFLPNKHSRGGSVKSRARG